MDVSLSQLQAGLAWHFKRYADEQPIEERNAYSKAEDVARVGQLGLWQDKEPLAPWEWRSSQRQSNVKSNPTPERFRNYSQPVVERKCEYKPVMSDEDIAICKREAE